MTHGAKDRAGSCVIRDEFDSSDVHATSTLINAVTNVLVNVVTNDSALYDCDVDDNSDFHDEICCVFDCGCA